MNFRKMKKNIYKYILMASALMGGISFLDSCQDDALDYPKNDISSSNDEIIFNEDGSVTMPVVIEIPELGTANTRGEMGYIPNNTDLSLYLLVFETETGNIVQREKISQENQWVEDKDHSNYDEREYRKLIKFTVNLYPTDRDAAIQLIATDQNDLMDQFRGIGNRNLIKTIYTNSTIVDDKLQHRGAYWARIDLKEPILSADDNSKEEVKEAARENAERIKNKLHHVPMVRNFLRISAHTSLPDFQIDGLYVVNTCDRGAVAPYMHDENVGTHPDVKANHGFIYFYEEDKDDSGNVINYISKKYEDISKLGYIGEPAEGTTVNSDPVEGRWDVVGNIESPKESCYAVYLYERPFRGEDRTYAIIKGRRRTNIETNTWSDPMFYKVDLGYQDKTDGIGVFKYYNLIRNFNYRINITGVDADGYARLDLAQNGVVFNNITASVEVKNLNTISDGNETIIVDKTSYVITKDMANAAQGGYSFTIGSQYLVKNNGVQSNESQSLQAKLSSGGENIFEVTKGNYTDGIQYWNVKLKNGVTFDERNPTQVTLYIYRGKKDDNGNLGLYREITLTLIKEFKYDYIDTFAGLWEDYEDAPWNFDNDAVREVGQGIDAPLTLFFQLPQGLPEAIFPLDFTIESDRQNIQNAYVGTAAVKTVPNTQSLFWNTLGYNISTARIQYQKTLTWTEYNEQGTTERPATGSRIVRVRFLTTTDLAQDGIGGAGAYGESTTTLRIYNQYFGIGEDQFTRDTKTSDPTPHVWNFSSDAWANVLSTLNNSRNNNNRYNAATEDLMITENETNSVKSGKDEETGFYYIIFKNDNDQFTYRFTYQPGHKRGLRIDIVTDDPENAPIVKARNQTLTGVVDNTATSLPYTNWAYERDVDATSASQTIDITIKRPADRVTNFYEITVTPKYKEYNETEP